MPLLPASDAGIEAAAAAIRRREVVAFPTETFYGLATDALDPSAVEAVIALKGREPDKPIALVIPEPSWLDRLAAPGSVNDEIRRLANAYWPGPLTLVVDAAPGLPSAIVGPDGGVGMRVSSHPIALALARRVGRPLTATSANRAGGSATSTAADVVAALGDALLVLDGGTTPGGPASTIARVHADGRVVVLRRGAIPI
jgi:L-threonylcarbamoyladenylate synthase